MLNEKISEIIKQNLPETVAGELKQFIEQANDTAKELEELKSVHVRNKDHIKTQEFNISVLKNQVTDLKAQIAMCENCKERYSEIAHKEAITSIKEGHCNERIADMKEITSLAFRSPVYKKTVSGNKGVTVDVGRDCCGFVQDHTETKTTEVSEE